MGPAHRPAAHGHVGASRHLRPVEPGRLLHLGDRRELVEQAEPSCSTTTATPIAFDPPLQFSYQHSLENDANGDPTYAGKNLPAQLQRPGRPVGHPDAAHGPRRRRLSGTASTPSSRSRTACCSAPTARRIRDQGRGEGADAAARGPERCARGQTIGPVGRCRFLDGSDYVAPNIGPKPVIDEPPAVIDGVVQTSG